MTGYARLCDADGGCAYGLPPELLALLRSGQAAWRYLSLPRAVAQVASAAAVTEAADWWRLTAAVVDRAVPCSTGDADRSALASLGESLAVAWGLLPDCGVLSLQAEPPPALAAALDGGLLRCLELLLRRAGRDPQGPESTLLQGLGRRVPGKCQGFGSYLVPLLAYGEPRQAAALLATMRKVLRTADSRALGTDETGAVEHSSHDGLFLVFTGGPACFLTAVRAQEEEAAAADAAPGDEPPSPASQQLLRLLSCAACEWLPELSQSLSQPLRSSGMASPGLLTALLIWLPPLAGRCVVQPCAAANRNPTDDDAGGGASGGGGEAADDGGWRALLMEEVGAVALLDASLRMVPRVAELHQESRLPLLRSLVAACCTVAAVARGVPRTAAEGAAGRPKQQEAGDAAAAMGQSVPWRSGRLREAAAGLRSYADQDMAAHAEGLGAYLELGGDCAFEALRQASPPPGPLASALPPPTEARRLMPGRCANPRCANLESDSEADLTLKACAGCGTVGYCCRPCQTAHWRGGHKDECARRRDGGGR
ncbi:hypothetical protein GPECTOR_43g892 [Gonium pectorale]|uniref:phytol kinase n=1 Tax=Gonium pectorale TaxID=33097 RepID=A0A150G9C6_GONPE|nr:hypothetical protein GPECTOR_43g892 [Gonium pectorale]|eukprot:KXZ46456.1 hypothetical protein GPECTOR_43g892 [Gonium pectorale]